MSSSTPEYDVIIVGYGPVSEVLALALGRQGRSVAVFERWTERYPLPRAVCIDHEMYRMLSHLGMQDELPAVSHSGPLYQWFNADWKELLCIDWSAESISGGPEVNFVHQPTLETMFETHVSAQPTVDVKLGFEAIGVTQSEDSASLLVEETATGERREYTARYVVGCDGANSLVRSTIGGEQEDRGFEADWLVVDILPNEGVELDIPAAGQWCNPLAPTTIVPAGVRDGRFYRRWEFMRLPSQTIDEISSEEHAWERLKPWVTPDQAKLIRHKVYTFRSLLAEKWRDGRILIAGDAAHVMPPFMGQGMCAGLRDAWNLAWKFDLILGGKASDAILDTYQAERNPHVSDVIDLSMYLGRLICQPDPEKALERDHLFFSGAAEPPPPFPHLTQGILAQGAGVEPNKAAGLLSPHGHVRVGDRELRFDDLSQPGFVLIAQDCDILDDALNESLAEFLGEMQINLYALDGKMDGVATIQDLDGKYQAFLSDNRVRAVLVRPDYYVFGGASDGAGLRDLLASLKSKLHVTSSG